MRFAALAATALCLLLAPSAAYAIQITGIELYPAAPSASAGFIAVVRAVTNASAKVSWMSPEACAELKDSCFGQFQRSGDAFVCYFSNSDANATCGPSPFRTPGFQYNFVVYGVESGPVVEQKKQIVTGAVPFNVFVQTVANGTNSTVKIQVFQLMDSVSYKIYDSGMVEKASGSLQRNEYGTFVGDLPYSGSYRYIVFSGTGPSGTAGGAVTVPAAPTQQSTAAQTYNVEAQEVKVYDAVVKQGSSWKYRNCRVTNRGDAIQNLTVKVPDALKKYLKATLDNTTLAPNASTMLALEIPSLQSHLELSTALPLMIGDKQVGEAEVNIKISIVADEAGGKAREPPSVAPSIIDKDYLLQETKESLSVINNDGSSISILKYSAADLGVPINVTLPEGEIAPAASGKVEVTFKPVAAGTYRGLLALETDAGNALVFMRITFHSNSSSRASELASALDAALAGLSTSQKSKLSSATKSVEDDLTAAGSSFDSGYYSDAEAKLASADAKITMLKAAATALKGSASDGGSGDSGSGSGTGDTTPVGGGFDPTIIIIVLIIGLGAFGAWYYFKKVRKSGWEGEVEDDF